VKDSAPFGNKASFLLPLMYDHLGLSSLVRAPRGADESATRQLRYENHSIFSRVIRHARRPDRKADRFGSPLCRSQAKGAHP